VLAGIACFVVPASAARIAPYLNKYEEVAAPAEADKILMPSNNIAIWWGQESIVGEWTPPTGYTDENRYGDAPGCICWMDNDMKTALLRYGIPTVAKQLVFADAFTAYGAGDYGYSKMQPSDWERFSLSGSMDGQNWFAIPFTVKYHLEVGRMYYGTHPTSLEEPTDLWWHLVFEEEVEFEYLAFHTSNAASQDDAAYELCFPMDHNYMYVTNTLPSAPGTEEPITDVPATETPVESEAPATDAPATDDPATDAPTADGSETDSVTDAPATTEGGADS
jgi:hypothetical protein